MDLNRLLIETPNTEKLPTRFSDEGPVAVVLQQSHDAEKLRFQKGGKD